MIVPMTQAHVDVVARLHCATLTGLVTNLGLPAARAFYAGCVKSGSTIGFVDVADGAVAGFVLGSTHPETVKREVLRHNAVRIVSSVALGIIRRPASFVWLVRSFRGPDEGSYDRQAAELTYLAVTGQRRQAGIGRRLVEAFSNTLKQAGAASYELSVDDDNRSAIAFYERLGFRVVGRYREFGIVHRRYRLRFDGS